MDGEKAIDFLLLPEKDLGDDITRVVAATAAAHVNQGGYYQTHRE